jgi:hypothetical protein
MLLFALNPEPGLVPPMPAPQGDRTSASRIRICNVSFPLKAAAIVSFVLSTVPMLSPGVSSLVSTNAMVVILHDFLGS